MTDDKRPIRLFLIPDYESDTDETDSYWGNVFTDDPGQGPLVEMANSFWAVPESAYDRLAEKLAKAESDNTALKAEVQNLKEKLSELSKMDT